MSATPSTDPQPSAEPPAEPSVEQPTPSGVTVYGADWCRDCRRTKAQLDALPLTYTYIDLIEEPDAAKEAHRISGRTNIPVVVYPDGSHQVEPSNLEVAAKLALLGLA